jgi:uncharacterized membrane protein
MTDKTENHILFPKPVLGLIDLPCTSFSQTFSCVFHFFIFYISFNLVLPNAGKKRKKEKKKKRKRK